MSVVPHSYGGLSFKTDERIYKAGTPQLLDQFLVSKFGEDAVQVLKEHTERMESLNRDDPAYGKFDPLHPNFKNTLALADESIKYEINKIVTSSLETAEVSEGSSRVTTEAEETESKLPPIIVCRQWHDTRYEYIKIAMELELWELMNSSGRRFKRYVASKIQQIRNLDAAVVAKNVTATMPNVASVGASIVGNAIGNWMNRVADKTNQRREWRQEQKDLARNKKDLDRDQTRIKNDPFLSKVGYSGRTRTTTSRAQTSPVGNLNNKSWAHVYSGTSERDVLSKLGRELGNNVLNGIWKTGDRENPVKLTKFNDEIYANEDEANEAKRKFLKQTTENSRYLYYILWTHNTGIQGQLLFDAQTGKELNKYINANVIREDTKIILTVGQIRRLIREAGKLI